MHHFYNGLSIPTRTLIDASIGEVILGKNEVKAFEILENIALNNCQWPTERVTPKKPVGVHELDTVTSIFSQISMLCKQL